MRLALTVSLFGSGVLAAAGCGGTDRNERDGDFAKYSVSDVQKRFAEATGARLSASSYSGQLVQSLRVRLDSSEPGLTQRFGGVTIYVTANKARLDSLAREDSDPGSTKVMSNVVVRSNGFDETAGPAFRRVVAVVESLGKPASAVKLGDVDTPCSRLGIDADSGEGKEGVCVGPDQQSLRVVNSDSALALPGVTLRGVGVGTGTTLSSREDGFARRRRASDAYVAVSLAVQNTGDEPLERLNFGLVIDGRSYSADSPASTLLSSLDDFPIQPGATRRAGEVFDIPSEAARSVTEQGAVQVDVVRGISAVVAGGGPTAGRIRLAGARRQTRPSGTTRLSGSL